MVLTIFFIAYSPMEIGLYIKNIALKRRKEAIMSKNLGIDVSSNNGVVDFEKAKASGVQYVIIRVGYGSDISEQDDEQAMRNMQECERLNMPYGVYLYSYALNLNEAESEVAHVLRIVQGFNPLLGVWFDMEDADGYKERHNFIPYNHRQEITDFCRHFCSKMQENGYKAGIYANKNYWDNVLYADQLSDYPVWLAHWGIDEPSMECLMWQYTSDGNVDGISDRVDMNYYYGELPILNDEEEKVNEYEGLSLNYKIGDEVSYNKIYSTSSSDEALTPLFTTGTITNVIYNARNPYLIDNGTGWINDDCIVNSSPSQEETTGNNITEGDVVKFVGSTDYDGTYITPYHNDTGYIVKELNEDRVVLEYEGQIFAAVNICDVEKL